MTGPCRDDVCVTCADELTPVTVIAISDDGLTAHGRIDGEACEIALDLIDGVRVGDVLLTHGGVALQLAPSESVAEELAAHRMPAVPPTGPGTRPPDAPARSTVQGAGDG